MGVGAVEQPRYRAFTEASARRIGFVLHSRSRRHRDSDPLRTGDQSSQSFIRASMHKNRATAEATSAYASRHSNLAGNFRKVIGLDISSIGIGTYLGETDEETDHAYEEAIAAAIRGGINLIDTAVNYRFQRSERNIGKVINELVASKEIHREEIVVAPTG